MAEVKETQVTTASKPLQRISWKEKTKDKMQWFKDNGAYYVAQGNFGMKTGTRDLDMLYQVYNHQFPMTWFSHITNPLNAQEPKHKNFPAKVRPVNILRTNLDYLIGDYRSRPFKFHVSNLDDGAYNTYQEQLIQTLNANLKQHFEAIMQGEGQEQEIPLPEEVVDKFRSKYKDALAIKGQRWLKRLIKEYRMRMVHFRCFKDWVIAGEAYTFKGIIAGDLVYERVSPKDLKYFKSPEQEFVEDSEWVVRRKAMTLSTIVDWWYDQLKEEELKNLETGGNLPGYLGTPASLVDHLRDTGTRIGEDGLFAVHHIQWKGKKKVKIIQAINPVTGEEGEIEVDEDYPQLPGEEVRVEWRNEGYETWMLADGIFVDSGPIVCPRNEMINKSKLKLSYNGRIFSDTHADPISVMEIGLPYQILFMITYRTIELALAKSKGKLFFFDKKAIPVTDGWTEEKFFYYAEAKGWVALDRSQIGVDRNFNQYNVVDMTMYDHIDQLIGLKNSIKEEWDDLVGIPRAKRGQTKASDGKAVNESSIYQSSIVTDVIFSPFEEFVESDLQGILDLSKYMAVDGVYQLFNGDDYETELIEIDPLEYCSASLGLVVESSLAAHNELNLLKSQIPNFIQNGMGPKLVAEVLLAESTSSLKNKFEKFEEIQQQMATKSEEIRAQSAQLLKEAEMALQQLKHEHKMEEIEAEGEQDLEKAVITETIKGSFNTFTFQDGDANDNNIPDAAEVMDLMNTRHDILSSIVQKAKELGQKKKEHSDNVKLKEKELTLKEKEIESKERIAKDKNKTMLKNKTSGEK